MNLRSIRTFLALALIAFLVSGCATARPRNAQAKAAAANSQVTALQSEIQAKDAQIQDLQYQLDQNRQPKANYTSAYGSSGKGKSSNIRVSGVSVSDVQAALSRAGFDPGAADGKMGKKTKSAIKAFQRVHGLKADGVIGDKTWRALQS